MARVFSYPDAQRCRVGTSDNEIPVNSPHVAPAHTYTQDGAARHHYRPATSPVYAPSSFSGPTADLAAAGIRGWENDGALVHAASLHTEDSDVGQAGTLHRDVLDAAARARFLETLTGQGRLLTVPGIVERFLGYWTAVDADLGAALRTALS